MAADTLEEVEGPGPAHVNEFLLRPYRPGGGNGLAGGGNFIVQCGDDDVLRPPGSLVNIAGGMASRIRMPFLQGLFGNIGYGRYFKTCLPHEEADGRTHLSQADDGECLSIYAFHSQPL